jgi:phage terminase large subunit-like protein
MFLIITKTNLLYIDKVMSKSFEDIGQKTDSALIDYESINETPPDQFEQINTTNAI